MRIMIRQWISGSLAVGALAVMLAGSTALGVAAPANDTAGGGSNTATVGGGKVSIPVEECIKIGLPVLPNFNNGSCPKGTINNDPKTGGAIVNYLRQWLILLSGAAGLIILLMITIAGFQYIISRGDPGNVKSAKNRLTNAIIAFVLYLMAFAILTFLLPGGLFT